jgi:glycosyltransferase involved in cell wall biosynthesis
MKILQVLTHSAHVFSVDLSSLLLDGWHTRLGRELAKHSDCQVECLTFDPCIDKPLKIKIGNNLTLKAFPSISVSFAYEYSHSEINYIKKVFSEEQDVILHIHGFPTFFAYMLITKIKRNIVVQDHGGGITFLTPLWNLTGKYVSQYIDYIFVLSQLKKEYIRRYYGIDPARIKIQTMGIDLNKFRPLPQSKCRDLLNLPHDVKLVLYVGRFNYFKGLPLLIEEMYKLKTENAELVCVGGVPGDPLYHMVKKKVKFCFGRVPHSIMPYFYNACDVLAYFWKDVRWGGPSIAVMEAMACNKPVVSNTLLYSGINKDELEKRGCFIPLKVNEIGLFIKEALSRHHFSTRELAEKYFGWDSIVTNTIAIYRKILEK